MEISNLKEKSKQIRRDVVSLITKAKGGHIGGSLSEVDILVSLYYRIMNIDPKNPYDREGDRFILSKGHAVESYYCVLADRGFITKEELDTFGEFGTYLIGHPNNKVNGVYVNTGALGHGLPIAVGMAKAAKINKSDKKIYVVMGDGEQAEGSVWEAAMAASHYKLNNLIAFVDRNRLQITGSTEDVMALEPFGDKWRAFGFNVVNIDGNDIEQIVDAVENNAFKSDKPSLILCNTIKGKGVSFMENLAGWHHKVPTQEQLDAALVELA